MALKIDMTSLGIKKFVGIAVNRISTRKASGNNSLDINVGFPRWMLSQNAFWGVCDGIA